MSDGEGAIRIPKGLRWSCRSCGSCCTSDYDLGPVEPEVIDDLTEVGIGALWPPASEGWYQLRQDGAYLSTVDGHCVFLRDDKRCAVHDLVGGARKPGFCREFPYHLVEDTIGWVAVVRPTCRGFHHSFVDGDPVADQVEEVAALPRVVPRRRFAPESVSVLDGASVPIATWMAGETRLLEEIRGLSFDSTMAHLRGVLHAHAGREAPVIRPEQRAAALQAIVQALTLIMAHTLKQSGNADPERVAFAEESLRRLESVARGLGEPAPPLAKDAEEWVNLLVRSALLGKRFAVWGGVAEGMGELILAVEFSRRLAEHRTGGVTAAALSEPMAHWRRFAAIELITMILRKARPALIDLLLHGEPR